jgi:hypothetical protein
MKIILYASIDKEQLYDKGMKAGLKDKALEFFMHFNEVPIVAEVNEKGEIIGSRVVPYKELKELKAALDK